MIRTTATLLALCAAAFPAGGAQTAALPPAPGVPLPTAKSLVALARQAMREYLIRRTPAEAFAIPQAVAGLGDHAAAVTLRSGGKAVAQAVRPKGDLARTVVAAALKAMRSDRLPDRVTAELLDSLTIELEIIGPARPMNAPGPDGPAGAAAQTGPSAPPEDIAAGIIPGLTGAAMVRGAESAIVLPSTAYLEGLAGPAIVRRCLAQVRLTPQSILQPPQWHLFATRHFVGFPDRVYWLYRGKILLPHEALDEPALAAAAASVGEFLARNQSPEGEYRLADGQEASLADHLYATWAMARLARHAERRDFASSANAALAHAARSVQRRQGMACVVGPEGREEPHATALLLLAAAQSQASEESRRLQEQLQAYLKAALGELSKPRPAGTATAGASARWAAAAWLALKGGQGAQELDERPLMTVRAELARSGASQAEAWLWAARAGIVDPDTLRRTGPALQFRDDAGPPDERGGCGTAGQGPATVLTALWVMYQAGGARGPAASQSASAPAENPQRVLAARRFCCQMVYRSREAFFAADPDRWVGAVRVRADSAEVTLEACAAALEALLARPGG